MTRAVPETTTFVEPLDRDRSDLTVLFVGVDRSTRSAVTDALAGRYDEVASTSVETASAARDAIDGGVDCAISAASLDGTTGLALLREVVESHPRTARILFPETDGEVDPREAINADVDGYFERRDVAAEGSERLADRVQSVVDQRRERWRRPPASSRD